jgi:anaerobic magnesium-protoporphyrin IX monomethyl ester cyclase
MEPRRLWLDLGGLGDLVRAVGPHEQWQDHGLGLLRTILHRAGVATDLESTRNVRSWRALAPRLAGYDVLLMNVRSYTYPIARRAARLFKEANPDALVLVGGLHASVALGEMLDEPAFDRICRGPGEGVIVDLVRDPLAFGRVVEGVGARAMGEWPFIDRTLWPRPRRLFRRSTWPLEPACGWGPPPVATVLTSRVCPWQCSFCNESAYVPAMARRPVDLVIDELNELDRVHGPLGSVVIHDSMFFQSPGWLEEWLGKLPRRARRRWPYWAAARADTVRRWPELFAALVRETGWTTVSIGFESGSDRVLRILNKECTEEDNEFTIDLVNRLGDDLEREGREPPRFWANVMLGVPGETRDDALRTMRMLRRMRRVLPSISFYAPYPGSALGHQLIAEGRSLMTREDYHRFPSDEKVAGVDYGFYRDLLAGRFDAEIARAS